MDKYKCMICGKPATEHYCEVINGQERSLHYCSDCAKLAAEGMTITNLMSSLLGVTPTGVMRKTAKVCKCGATETEIINTGKFGCSECYETFKDLAYNYAESMGVGKHKGKSPIKYATPELSEREMLYKQLENAVKEENYAEAARIKSRIDELNG